ncbi:hypothetical protein [Pseudonocardia sp.]|uniref:hypothetical protein n=1 Tax=Pseudonocardia sp. TaxID=60912 RepID=UPI003D0BE5C5
MTCLRCDRPFIPGHPDRAHQARRLDRQCYDEAKGCGELDLYPRKNKTPQPATSGEPFDLVDTGEL